VDTLVVEGSEDNPARAESGEPLRAEPYPSLIGSVWADETASDQ
jgi:hypothetical protein